LFQPRLCAVQASGVIKAVVARNNIFLNTTAISGTTFTYRNTRFRLAVSARRLPQWAPHNRWLE
jgi:hypothetical protein